MSHYRRDVVGRGISTGLGLGLRRRLSGGALPVLFGWNPETATALPATSTFTRASIASVLTTTDGTTFWYQGAKSGEVRLDGMRRVENFIPEEDDSSWTLSGGATILSLGGGEYRVTCPATTDAGAYVHGDIIATDLFGFPIVASAEIKLVSGGPTVELVDPAQTGGEARTVTLTGSYQKFQWNPKLSDSVGDNPGLWFRTPSATALVFEFKSPQLQAAQAVAGAVASAYVNNSVTYNAEVNGVRYFATDEANTVDGSGVVTEATGTTITGGGYLPEPAATNLALHSRDFTDAVWVAVNITPVQNAIGVDGAVRASTLTATAGNGTILQSFTRASSTHAFSVFVARKTGTGTIEMTIDGGTTWVDITSSLSSDITDRFQVIQTLANPSIGFRIVTSGDEIEVDISQLEDNAGFVTSPIITSGSTVTRSEDNITDQVITVPNSGVADVTVPTNLPENRPAIMDNGGLIRFRIVAGQIQFINNDMSFILSASSSYEGERHKYAWSIDTNELIGTDDEGNNDSDSPGTAIGGTIRIGRSSSANSQLRGVVHNISFYTIAQTLDQLDDLVS